MLLLHIIIALASIGLFAGRIFSQNSQLKFSANLSAVATVITGTALVFGQTTSLSHACISGVAYLGIVVSLSHIARFARLKA